MPDVQDLAANVNMRATFLAGGDVIAKGEVTARTIDLAPTLSFLLGIPEPQHSQGRVLLDVLKGGERVQADLDRRAERLPRAARPDGARRSTESRPSRRRRGLPRDAVRRGARGAAGPGLILAGGDNVGASPPNSALLEDIPAIDVENAWGLDATSYGNHEFDYGVERLLKHQARANFPFLGDEHRRDGDRARPRPWVTPSKVFTIDGIKVGVIGAELESTPELVSAGATAGLRFLDEGPRIKAESERLRQQGVRVQIVVIHEGTSRGQNTIGNTRRRPVGRARSWASPTSCRTRRSTR